MEGRPEALDLRAIFQDFQVFKQIVAKLSLDNNSNGEGWYLPPHLVHHNGKYRVVFNCSFQFKGLGLNKTLMPGPQLSPSLLGVLLHFREHAIAVSDDIRSMFHQIRLVSHDKPVLLFLWWDQNSERVPEVFLSSGGLKICQWASNVAAVVSQIPKEARSDSTDLWLLHEKADASDPALGLHSQCSSDTL